MDAPPRPHSVESRPASSTHDGTRGRARVIVILLVVLGAGGVQVSCGSETDTGADCGQTPTTSQPRNPRTGGTGSAGGSASVPRGSAPPPSAARPPPPPTPVNGRLALTAANTLQTIVVPAGTVIEVRLEPVSGSVWTLPESSDPQALPRLSASDPCDAVKVATFRAVSEGEISATRPIAHALAALTVTIRVAG